MTIAASEIRRHRPFGSALGRGLIPSLPSNLAVISGFGVAAIAVGVRGQGDGTTSTSLVGHAAGAGIAVFLAWALARELDPDHTLPAWATIPPSIALAWNQPAELLAVFTLIVGARLLLRSVGDRLTWMDWVGIPVLALLAARERGGWVCALALAAAVALDTRLDPPTAPWQLASALTAGVLAVVAAIVSGAVVPDAGPVSSAVVVALAAATVLAVALIWLPAAAPRSRDDHDRALLSPARLRVSNRITAATVVLAGLAAGAHGGEALWPLMVATSAVALARPLVGRRHASI